MADLRYYMVHNDLHRTVKVWRSLNQAEHNTDQYCRVVQIESSYRGGIMATARKICKQFDCLLKELKDDAEARIVGCDSSVS